MSRMLRLGLLALACALPLGFAATADAAPRRPVRGHAFYAPRGNWWHNYHGHRYGYHHYRR